MCCCVWNMLCSLSNFWPLHQCHPLGGKVSLVQVVADFRLSLHDCVSSESQSWYLQSSLEFHESCLLRNVALQLYMSRPTRPVIPLSLESHCSVNKSYAWLLKWYCFSFLNWLWVVLGSGWSFWLTLPYSPFNFVTFISYWLGVIAYTIMCHMNKDNFIGPFQDV